MVLWSFCTKITSNWWVSIPLQKLTWGKGNYPVQGNIPFPEATNTHWMMYGGGDLKRTIEPFVRPPLQLHCSTSPLLSSASHTFTPPQVLLRNSNTPWTENSLHRISISECFFLENSAYYDFQTGCKLRRKTWFKNSISTKEHLNFYYLRWSTWWVEQVWSWSQKLNFGHTMFEIILNTQVKGPSKQ